MLRSFARRCSRAAASRTCETVPGAEPSSSLQSDCTESTTQTSGASAAIVAQTASRLVSASTPTPATAPSRSARRRTWAGDSSPAISSTRARPASFASSAAVRLDLPMPGSPASRTIEPGTSPPPSTRSSSPMPVRRRFACSSGTSASGTTRPASAGAAARPAPLACGARSSASVDQASQPGHWPSQRGSLRPHSLQTKTVLGGRAMDAPHYVDTRTESGVHVGSPTGRAGRRRARLSVVRGRGYGEVQVRVLDGVQRGLRRDLARLQLTVGTEDLEVEPTGDVVPDQPDLSPVGGGSGFEFTLHMIPLYDRNRRLVGAV